MSNPCKIWITNLIPYPGVRNCIRIAQRYCYSARPPAGLTVFGECARQIEIGRITTGPVCVITKQCQGVVWACSTAFSFGDVHEC